VCHNVIFFGAQNIHTLCKGFTKIAMSSSTAKGLTAPNTHWNYN